MISPCCQLQALYLKLIRFFFSILLPKKGESLNYQSQLKNKIETKNVLNWSNWSKILWNESLQN